MCATSRPKFWTSSIPTWPPRRPSARPSPAALDRVDIWRYVEARAIRCRRSISRGTASATVARATRTSPSDRSKCRQHRCDHRRAGKHQGAEQPAAPWTTRRRRLRAPAHGRLPVEPAGAASAPNRSCASSSSATSDHGKSTLWGSLSIFSARCRMASRSTARGFRRRGMPFEWAFLLDALQAERDQGVTSDTTQVASTARSAAISSSTRRVMPSSCGTW